MEKIHDPENYNTTQNINVKSYFDAFRDRVLRFNRRRNQDVDAKIFDMIGIKHNAEKLWIKEGCNPDLLDCEGEKEPLIYKPYEHYLKLVSSYEQPVVPEGAENLACVRYVRSRENNTDKEKEFRKLLEQVPLDIKNYPVMPSGRPPSLKPAGEFLVFVRVMRPFASKPYSYRPKPLTLDREIVLLGTNTLADLRDKITCVADEGVLRDMSDDPELPIDTTALAPVDTSKCRYPSGFIFIDGVFYNDCRSDTAVDYSELIRDWAIRCDVGRFDTAKMEETAVGSLTPRFGYPYVYQHQGGCEHVLLFSNARLLCAADSMNRFSYPYYSLIGEVRGQMCIFCAKHQATWLVKDSDRIPQNNALVCSRCFKSYNYVNGKKVNDFKAYPYMKNLKD